MAVIYYTDSTPVVATATVAAATATATLAGANGRSTFITGFIVSGLGATAATSVAVTVTGVQGGTQTYQVTVPAGATTAITPLVVNFPMPLPSAGTGTNIVISMPTFGAGNTNANITAYGYLK